MEYPTKSVTLIRIKNGKEHKTTLKGNVRFHLDLPMMLQERLIQKGILKFDIDDLLNMVVNKE